MCNRTPEQAFEATWVRHFRAVRPPSWCRALGEAILAQCQSRKQKRQFSFCFLAEDNDLFTDNPSWRGHSCTSHPRPSRAFHGTAQHQLCSLPAPDMLLSSLAPLHSPGSFISIALTTAEAQERLDLVVTNDSVPALESRWLSNDCHVPEHGAEHPGPEGVVSWRLAEDPPHIFL